MAGQLRIESVIYIFYMPLTGIDGITPAHGLSNA